MTKKRHNLDDLMVQGKDLISFYRAHPCIAAYELLGVDLAPIQRLVFRDMWFKSYVIAVCGRGYGKSQYTGSLIHTKLDGLVYLNEVLPPIPAHLSDGEEEVIDWVDEIYTSEGFRNTKKLCLEKGITGKKIITQNYYENKGSTHHPLLVLNSKCCFEYKSMDEFIPGDRICIQRGQNTFGNNLIPLDEAYLIGLFIGGSFIGRKNYIKITTTDNYIKDFCINFCINNSVSYRVDKDRCTEDGFSIYFKQFVSFFDRHSIDMETSYTKSVPYSVRTSSRASQVAFLQGYFDTNSTVYRTNGSVSCYSVSKKLLKEVQMMLLNFGIIARLRKKKTKSKFGKVYLLDMCLDDALKFKELIGFRLKRKQFILNNYFHKKELNVDKTTIPYALQLCYSITQYYHNKYITSKKPPFNIRITNKKEITYDRLTRFLSQCEDIELAGFSLIEVREDIYKLKEILKYNYYFDTVISIDDWKGDCYDFEMNMETDVEPNYFSNGFIAHNTFMLGTLAALSCLLYPGYRVGLIGPVFRQSKMIFSEVEKLYDQSPILREATAKKPTRGSDTCYLKFKSVAGKTPSYIEGLPLGDGSKIRGSRFYLILIDELAQIPDQTLDMVVRPMGATALAPMERVRRLEEQTRLIKAGLAVEEDFQEEKVNKMVMTSSGYYKFNHMWRRMKDHWKMMVEYEAKGEECPYSVWQVPYWDLPDGFLDKANIAEAKRIMSSHEYSMEYEAAMVSDSEGFFKASLLEECTIDSDFTTLHKGDPNKSYVIGVDPNQGGSASCGVIVTEMGKPNKIVSVLELMSKTTQGLTQAVQSLCDQYKVIRIFMDRGGGGKAIMDLLEEGYGNVEPIIDRGNPDNIHKDGRHILEMVNFNPSWISDANFTTKSMFEDKSLRFPELTVSANDLMARTYESITTLKSQLLSIVVTQTSTGILHFDTPTKSMNKDLYSALILAAHGIRMVERELEEGEEPILHNDSGLFRSRTGSQGFNYLGSAGNMGLGAPPIGRFGLGSAVLHRKKK